MATTSCTGWRVPTSLFAHITVTRATEAGSWASAARSAPTSIRPSPSTRNHSTVAPSTSASHCTASTTASCSTADATMRTLPGSAARRAQNRPFTARLSASVPPEVNTTSARSGTERCGDALPRLFHRLASGPAGCVQRRRVAQHPQLVGDDRDDLGADRGRRSVVEIHTHALPQPFRFSISCTAWGSTVCRSPTTPKSAIAKIGASPSLLTTTTVFEVCIPALCWMAPEMPAAT